MDPALKKEMVSYMIKRREAMLRNVLRIDLIEKIIDDSLPSDRPNLIEKFQTGQIVLKESAFEEFT